MYVQANTLHILYTYHVRSSVGTEGRSSQLLLKSDRQIVLTLRYLYNVTDEQQLCICHKLNRPNCLPRCKENTKRNIGNACERI